MLQLPLIATGGSYTRAELRAEPMCRGVTVYLVYLAASRVSGGYELEVV